MWGAAIAAVGSWLVSKSQNKSQKKQMEDQAKIARETLEMQRKWQLEDRAYRQGAAGAWSKFANPAFMPQTYNQPNDVQNQNNMQNQPPQNHAALAIQPRNQVYPG